MLLISYIMMMKENYIDSELEFLQARIKLEFVYSDPRGYLYKNFNPIFVGGGGIGCLPPLYFSYN